MIPAAKHGDVQMGVDIHLCVVPPAPAPIPLPTPHMSIVFDPMDYVPFIGATITVCGMKRAIAGTNGKVVHIPPGFPFAPMMPSTEDELFMGSSTIVADGDPMSHLTHPVLSCQVAGMLSPFRAKRSGGQKSMVLPTVFNLATPTTVFLGGPPTISLMGMAFKAGFAALGKFGKLAKAGLAKFKKFRQKLFKNMKPGIFKCVIARAEPVNILSGAVWMEQQDFELPGRMPLEWNRDYRSDSDYVGLLGCGWQTIADTRLEVDQDEGLVLIHGPTFGLMVFEKLPAGEGRANAELELMDGSRLLDAGNEWRVETKEDKVYHFPKHLAHVGADGVRRVPIGRIGDRCGNGLDFEYRYGELAAIVESAGRRLVLSIEKGRLRSVVLADPSANLVHRFVSYEYDDKGDLVAVVDALDAAYRFAYDDHRMVRHTDRNGLSFYYTYEASPEGDWRVVHAWGDGGLYDYRFEYQDELNERRITDSLGYVSIVKLDTRGLPISEIDPLGGMTVYECDDAGRTTAVTDSGGRRTGYTYDTHGNLLELLRPDGAALNTEFDEIDKPVKVLDAMGHAWQQRFDVRGLLVEQVSPLGHVSQYEYDPHGQLVAFVNPRGARTQLAYDGVGLLRQITDALGYTTLFAHDPLGDLVAKGDALDRRTEYKYDAKGRLLAVKLPSGSEVLCGYDAEDNLTRYTDENGALTRLEYFGQGEIARRLQPDGHSVEYLYDTEERLIGVRNQRSEVYHLRRDALGRIVEEVDYWSQPRRYGYDGSGHLQWSEDPLKRRIDYECDPLGRILTKSFADERPGLPADAGPFVETFAYDANGNLTETANPHVQVTRAFDSEGRLVEEVQAQTSGQSFTVRNAYDEVSNRTKRVTESNVGPGHTTEYAFDLQDQSVEVRIDSGVPMRMQRDAVGQITTEELAPGLVRRFRYNADGLMTQQAVAKDGSALFATHYDYDRAGNLTQRQDSKFGIDQYVYDPMGRILEHTDPRGHLQRFFNDPAGDRLVAQVTESEQPTTVVLGPADTWKREGEYRGVHYCFDRAGNLTKKVDVQSRLAFAWDASQRLIASRRETRECRRITTYGYDPLGRRLFKETEWGRTWFGWDADHLALDMQDSGGTSFSYWPRTWAPLAMVVDEGAPPGEAKLYRFVTEPNGAPTRLVDLEGHCSWSANYSVSGRATIDRSSSIRVPLRLQGQYEDEETGLAYNRHRYYDPDVGAFASKDPVGLTAGTNLFSLGAQSLTIADPLGLTSCKKTFYSVQGSVDAIRLAKGGMPWPTGLSRANLGPGFYAWGSHADASAYLAKLEKQGAKDLKIVAYDIAEADLQRLRTNDLRHASDDVVNAFLEKHSHYGDALPHDYQHVIRNTGMGAPEHYFSPDAFSFFSPGS